MFERERKKKKRKRKERDVSGRWCRYRFQGHVHKPNASVGQHLPLQWLLHHCRSRQYNSPYSSTHLDFSFVPLLDSSSDHNILVADGVAFVLELNAKCKARFPECLAQVMWQLGSGDRFACIIHDEFMYFSQETAKDLKFPSIVLRLASAANFFAREALLQLKVECHLPFPGTLLYMFIQVLIPIKLIPSNFFGL
jgi:hypothetical protein